MYRLRPRATLVVALVAALVLLAPSAAFGTITGDRPFAIEFAENPEDGLLGVLEAPEEVDLAYGSNDGQGNDDAVTGHDGPVTLLVVQNNYDATMTLDVELDDGGAPPPFATQFGFASGGQTTSVAPGDTATVEADVVCAAQPPETWTVELAVTATDLSIDFAHEVTVTCSGPPGDGPPGTGPPGGQ